MNPSTNKTMKTNTISCSIGPINTHTHTNKVVWCSIARFSPSIAHINRSINNDWTLCFTFHQKSVCSFFSCWLKQLRWKKTETNTKNFILNSGFETVYVVIIVDAKVQTDKNAHQQTDWRKKKHTLTAKLACVSISIDVLFFLLIPRIFWVNFYDFRTN